MPRTARATPAGLIYHILNRSVGRMRMFRRDSDFEAFQRVMLEAHDRVPLPILSYCIMPSHWHFVVEPEDDAQVTAFFRWLAHTHAMRWRVSHNTVGYGHLYQGRFKSFPVETGSGLLSVCRYVERNARSAGLVRRAEHWQWCSLWARRHPEAEINRILSRWPTRVPSDWLKRVNATITPREMDRLHLSLKRNQPFGSEQWMLRIARQLDLEHTMRPEGRPKKSGERD